MSTAAVETPMDVLAGAPASLINSQGSMLLDPVQIKKSSAAKMRLADKTGNIALRKEAAAEQSFADRLGGRTALLSDELKRQIMQQKADAEKAASTSTDATSTPAEGEEKAEQDTQPLQEKSKRRNKKNRAQSESPSEDQESDSTQDTLTQRAPLKPTSQPFTPGQQKTQPLQQPTNLVIPGLFSAAFTSGAITLPPEALLLKLDAASKQSIADKTGNLLLKRTAALEQSLADKMAYVSAPGVTTTALRAGRKGFMLDPLFQAQQATSQTQQPKQKHVQLQDASEPTKQPRKQMQHSKSMTSVPHSPPAAATSTSTSTSTSAPSSSTLLQQPKKTMQHSKSLSSVQTATRADASLNWRSSRSAAPSSSSSSASTPFYKISAASTPDESSRADGSLNWRQPQPGFTLPSKSQQSTTQRNKQQPARPKSTSPTPMQMQRSASEGKCTKVDSEPVNDDLAKITQQIAEVIAPLTAAPSM